METKWKYIWRFGVLKQYIKETKTIKNVKGKEKSYKNY